MTGVSKACEDSLPQESPSTIPAPSLNLRAIKDVLQASLVTGTDQLDTAVHEIYASDLMSDVLAFGKPHSILLTGLATQQAVISAHMAEFMGVVFIRGKLPKDGSAGFAQNHHLVLLSTGLDMYEACARIESLRRGNPPNSELETISPPATDVLLRQDFCIEGTDFANSGVVSTQVKSILKTIGFDSKLIRRVAISTFEAEMNVVMHAKRAKVNLAVTPQLIELVIDDEGKGIPDVALAMQEGFTTATEEMRAMGFGSGMGLPNIRRNADELEVTSDVGKGTTLQMRFFV